MDLISLTIDGVQVEVAPGTTVLEAARQAALAMREDICAYTTIGD